MEEHKELYLFLKELGITKSEIASFFKGEIYISSIHKHLDSWYFMIRSEKKDCLIVAGQEAKEFDGLPFLSSDNKPLPITNVFLSHENALKLQALFPFTAPVRVLSRDRTFGVGDRLGIAGYGHLEAFHEYDATPVLAQQSMRELKMTGRTYEDVLDSTTFTVFREGYKGGYGADGDHLKTFDEIEYALRLGFTMITLDCSDHIVQSNDPIDYTGIKKILYIKEETMNYYLSRDFIVEDCCLHFTEEDVYEAEYIYGDAIRYTTEVYNTYFKADKTNADLELSIDETMHSTTPLQHFYIAYELKKAGVELKTMAPRFYGEFQKAIDYIGDLALFEQDIKLHAAIARYFGYKLSIHSGSDKFSVYELIGKYTRGHFHVKTAGTSWLEALKVVAVESPELFREVTAFSLTKFEEAKKYYHISTKRSDLPDLAEYKDIELKELITSNSAIRQLLHITYGFILTAKEKDHYIFKDKLFALWRQYDTEYAAFLKEHLGRHLSLLYKGVEQRSVSDIRI